MAVPTRLLRSHILLLTVLLISCTTASSSLVVRASVPMPHNLTEINSVVAFADGRLVVSDGESLWYRMPGAAAWTQLMLAHRSPCRRGMLQLAALPDQRLAYICPQGVVQQRHVYTLVAYDWSTDTLAPLVNHHLPDNGFFSWNHTMSTAVYADVDAYATLYWLTARGVQPLPITLVENGTAWFLPDSISAHRQWQHDVSIHRQQHPVGLAQSPVWSPTAEQIAFWATLEPIGEPYALRAYQWNLYLLDVPTLQVQRLVTGVRNPTALAWDRQGQRLAYTAGTGGDQPGGVWMYELQTGRNTLLQAGVYGDLSWSLDADRLYAVHCQKHCSEADELYALDLRGVPEQ